MKFKLVVIMFDTNDKDLRYIDKERISARTLDELWTKAATAAKTVVRDYCGTDGAQVVYYRYWIELLPGYSSEQCQKFVKNANLNEYEGFHGFSYSKKDTYTRWH